MTDDEIKASIKKEEGLRLTPYQDSLGNWTVGYGHKITSSIHDTIILLNNVAIPKLMAEMIFNEDYERAIIAYIKLDLDLDPNRRAAIVDMLFQMGLGGVVKFQKMLAHLRNRNWIQAAYELMNSRYAEQTPERAKRNRDRILKGTKDA